MIIFRRSILHFQVDWVYYWFQQQGETYSSEYELKFSMFKRSLMYNRTDGALVRLVTLISPDEEEIDAERRLNEFAKQISGVLTDYVPN
ncbi:MAG: EpsI family protein [gamma proteobacterium symbiont of Lucinoma myriamae]|nr:EpsI family protein [gamma proteobacterium symbiont of Lucinoma myriamae]MCU7817762.1 EpsI family protein [gamma proteobacterium symbiont of Lucinoma myriamae]MCU7833267.1 EpsI family protein [gamma proteobacterium symbiont of Lucinoma myriamae]